MLDLELLESGDLLRLGREPSRVGMIEHVVEREQTPHQHFRRGDPAAAEVPGAERPAGLRADGFGTRSRSQRSRVGVSSMAPPQRDEGARIARRTFPWRQARNLVNCARVKTAFPEADATIHSARRSVQTKAFGGYSGVRSLGMGDQSGRPWPNGGLCMRAPFSLPSSRPWSQDTELTAVGSRDRLKSGVRRASRQLGMRRGVLPIQRGPVENRPPAIPCPSPRRARGTGFGRGWEVRLLRLREDPDAIRSGSLSTSPLRLLDPDSEGCAHPLVEQAQMLGNPAIQPVHSSPEAGPGSRGRRPAHRGERGVVQRR